MQTTRQIVSLGRVVVRSSIIRAVPRVSMATPVSARLFSRSSLFGKEVSNKTHDVPDADVPRVSVTLSDAEKPTDLFGPGAEPGNVPTDFEQATGLERLELLGNMAGVDVFGMGPLPSDRIGTMEDPVVIDSGVKLQYLGCTGVPADSHDIEWMAATPERPSRCLECGSVYKLNYVGPEEDDHHHH
ncbi:cytochrome c oxidase subunit VB-domain-containing protein [Dipodascopsis uninucleata]